MSIGVRTSWLSLLWYQTCRALNIPRRSRGLFKALKVWYQSNESQEVITPIWWLARCRKYIFLLIETLLSHGRDCKWVRGLLWSRNDPEQFSLFDKKKTFMMSQYVLKIFFSVISTIKHNSFRIKIIFIVYIADFSKYRHYQISVKVQRDFLA